jgi:hypothetical protein
MSNSDKSIGPPEEYNRTKIIEVFDQASRSWKDFDPYPKEKEMLG